MGPVIFPDNKTPEKGSKYYKQAAEAFWGMYNRGETSTPSSFVDSLHENRLYAKGEQPVGKYISFYESDEGKEEVNKIQNDYIDSGMKPEQVREGWGNMDFENIPTIAPKISSALHGQFQDVDYVVSARSTDHRSGEERDKLKWRNWLRVRHDEWLQRVAAMGGIELEQPEFWPDSIAELHLHESAGGYKIPWETEIEKAISHGFDISNWEEIKSEAIDDIIAVNRFAVRMRTCGKSGKRIGDHLDLAKFAIQYSRHYDHRDSEMAGHWEEITIGELSRYFERSELAQIARAHVGKYGNPKSLSDDELRPDSMGLFKYDFFKVRVLHFSFIDYDNDYKASYKTPYGRYKERPVSYDYTPKAKETVTETSIRKLKKVSWVIDTELVYDWGVDNDMVRPDEKDVMLPYICIAIPGKSITDSAKVYYDDLVHIHLKTMNALITASGAGFAIDAGALEGVTLDNSPVSEMEIFDLYRHKSILVFRRKDSWGQSTSQGIPLMELPGGIGRFLDEQMKLFEHTMGMLETITGINPVTLGGVPEERTAVRNVQMSVKGTENILRPFIRGLKTLKKKMSTDFALSVPWLIKTYDQSYKAYEKVIGTPGVELIKMIEDDIYAMGISLEPMLTITHQENLLRMVELALQKDSQGQAGITVPEAMLIQERIILGAPLKMVRLEVTNMIRQAQKRLDAQRESLVRVQGEEMRAAEQQKQQHLLQKIDLDLEAKKEFDTHQTKNRVYEKVAGSNLTLLEQLMMEDETKSVAQ